MLLLEGANHFSIADPADSTTGRPFLDFSATQAETELRNLAATAIGLFIDAHVRHLVHERDALQQLLMSTAPPLIAAFGRK